MFWLWLKKKTQCTIFRFLLSLIMNFMQMHFRKKDDNELIRCAASMRSCCQNDVYMLMLFQIVHRETIEKIKLYRQIYVPTHRHTGVAASPALMLHRMPKVQELEHKMHVLFTVWKSKHPHTILNIIIHTRFCRCCCIFVSRSRAKNYHQMTRSAACWYILRRKSCQNEKKVKI